MSQDTEKPIGKRIKKLISELKSRDERIVIGALKRVPHEGSVEVIFPMLELLATEPSSEVQMLLEKSLFNLKDPAAIDPMMFALVDKKFISIRQHILTCIWQSGLDPSNELNTLIDIAINGDYMTGIEILTIVDNHDGFPDEDLNESIVKLDKVLLKKSEKTDLLGNLRQVLLDKLLG
jgi:hypothetical protein